MADKTFEWNPADGNKMPERQAPIIVELKPEGEATKGRRFNGQYVNVFSDNASFYFKNYFFSTDKVGDEKTFPVDAVKQWSPWFEGWEDADDTPAD